MAISVEQRDIGVGSDETTATRRTLRTDSVAPAAGAVMPQGTVTQVTLVVEDLPESIAFYGTIMGGEELYQDDSGAVFRLGGIVVNLLVESEGRALLAPTTLGAPGGRRAIITLEVTDVDAAVALVAQAGVPVLNGPLTRPWGPRTATIADPDGYIWELAHAE